MKPTHVDIDVDVGHREHEVRRSQLRGVAYRMLGSLSEADDAVQGAWLRRSRLRMAVAFEIRGGKIATLDIADRERLARLHLALLA